MRFDWLASPKVRRLAQEEARYAVREHGARAEEVLIAKIGQTGSEDRRQVYRMALKAVHGLK